MKASRRGRAGDASPGAEAQARAEAWVALLGNPNTGKTTLFNALTGGRAQTGNYPGVTVERTVGRLRVPGGREIRLLDLPGTYSLAARSPDEIVAVDVLLGRREDTPRPAAAVVVVDATNLERNLYLVTQVMETGVATVVALNMVDSARAREIAVDAAALSEALGVPVVPTVATRRQGVEDLARAVEAALDAPPPDPGWTWPEPLREAEASLAERLERLGLGDVPEAERRRALLDAGGEAERRLVSRAGAPAAQALANARGAVEASGVALAGLESAVRYGFIATVAARCLRRPAAPPVTFSDRLDAVLTHRWLGPLALVAVMGVLFLAIFSGAAPLMDLVDAGLFGSLAEAAEGWSLLGDGAGKSLVVDGIIAGVGSVAVFLPQILILFLLLSLLEGCGYMARAAFLMDRVLRGLGLSGRSFVPLLSSFACAVPGIMAARTIEHRRVRILTILLAPLMSCSARIPVYVLLIAAFVPPVALFGFLNLQAVVFAGMYLVGIVVAIPVALVLRRTLLRGETSSFLVELPPYRVPRASVVLRRTLDRGRAFLVRAGTVIFAASLVVWALAYFPRHPEPGAAVAARLSAAEREASREREDLERERVSQEQAVAMARTQGGEVAARAQAAYEAYLEHVAARLEAREAERAALEEEALHAPAAEQLGHSVLGRLGRFVEPVFAPLGWDWKVSSAVLASFPAREVVVSTLGVIYNLGEETEETSDRLRDRLRSARWDHGERAGRPVFDLPSALALLVFFALCAQCMSTLVVIRQETGHAGWAVFAFGYMTLLAYGGALLVATLARALL